MGCTYLRGYGRYSLQVAKPSLHVQRPTIRICFRPKCPLQKQEIYITIIHVNKCRLKYIFSPILFSVFHVFHVYVSSNFKIKKKQPPGFHPLSQEKFPPQALPCHFRWPVDWSRVVTTGAVRRWHSKSEGRRWRFHMKYMMFPHQPINGTAISYVRYQLNIIYLSVFGGESVLALFISVLSWSLWNLRILSLFSFKLCRTLHTYKNAKS